MTKPSKSFGLPSTFSVAKKKAERAQKRRSNQWAKSAPRRTKSTTASSFKATTAHLSIPETTGGSDPF